MVHEMMATSHTLVFLYFTIAIGNDGMTNAPLPNQEEVPLPRLVLFLSAGILAISASAILIRLSHAPSLVIAFWRITFSIVVLLPLWLQRQRWRELKALSTPLRWQLLGSGLCLGFHFWTWIASLKYTSVAASVLLVTTNPIWVGLLSPWILKERLSRKTWLGIAVAMFGASLIALNAESGLAETPNPMWGNVLATLGALAASGYLMMGRKVRPYLNIWSYASVTLWGAWIVLAVGVLLQPGDLAPMLLDYPWKEWLLFLSMALLPQMVGHNAISWSLRYIRADMVSVLLLLEPVGSTLLAILFLREVPSIMVMVAAPVLLVGIAMVVRSSSNERKSS